MARPHKGNHQKLPTILLFTFSFHACCRLVCHLVWHLACRPVCRLVSVVRWNSCLCWICSHQLYSWSSLCSSSSWHPTFVSSWMNSPRVWKSKRAKYVKQYNDNNPIKSIITSSVWRHDDQYWSNRRRTSIRVCFSSISFRLYSLQSNALVSVCMRVSMFSHVTTTSSP